MNKLFAWLVLVASLIMTIVIFFNNVQSAKMEPVYKVPTIESELKSHLGSHMEVIRTEVSSKGETKVLVKDNKNNFFFNTIFSDKNYFLYSNYMERYLGNQLNNIISARLQANNITGYVFTMPNRIAGDDDRQKIQDFIQTTEPEYFSGTLYVFEDETNLQAIATSLKEAHIAIEYTPIQLTVISLKQTSVKTYTERFAQFGEVEINPADIQEQFIMNSLNGDTKYEKS